MTECVFPGSFDPVTKGHMNLITRAAALFDHVTVTVMVNIRKSGTIPVDKRIELLEKACSHLSNVDIDRWDGLLADYMHEKKAAVVRGLRSESEFDHEMEAFSACRLLDPDFETVFIPSDPLFTGVTSSVVREIAAFGGDISKFVPEELTEEISQLLSNR